MAKWKFHAVELNNLVILLIGVALPVYGNHAMGKFCESYSCYGTFSTTSFGSVCF